MRSFRRPVSCRQCISLVRKTSRSPLSSHISSRPFHQSSRTSQAAVSDIPPLARPPSAPKPTINIKHIRQNPELYETTCRERNYTAAASYPQRINALFSQWQTNQSSTRHLRERANIVRSLISRAGGRTDDEVQDPTLRGLTRDQLLDEARTIKAQLSEDEQREAALTREIDELALALPNLTSDETPRGDEPTVLSYINDHPEPAAHTSDRVWRSHVHIGAELGILDFAAGGVSSGWGWYYLLDEAAQLEQALVAYALATATRAGWRQISPPSVVYSHIAAACGFQPRDAHGETQIYTLAQAAEDAARGVPELCLAGTAEIPLAGMRAGVTLDAAALPLKHVAVSRSFRAEAGARGVETKGLYRVHEFTKVEMFGWTAPDADAATDLFDEMVDLQTEVLGSLGLHCRVLEMPSADLGASATRKCDIEAFFPSRRERNDGWGEVTSASICTDYQTRRLGTRMRAGSGKADFPWTVNGTALAVPRVLAAILENGWDEEAKTVTIPEVLRPWMDGKDKIGPKHR